MERATHDKSVVTYKEDDEEKQIIVPLPKFDIGAAYKQLGDGVEVIACKAQDA
jgi:hypothetical protein